MHSNQSGLSITCAEPGRRLETPIQGKLEATLRQGEKARDPERLPVVGDPTAGGDPDDGAARYSEDHKHGSDRSPSLIESDENRKLLSLAMDAAGMGAWELDFSNNQLKWSYGHFALFGIEPEQFDGSVEAALNAMHEKDRDRVWSDVLRAKDNKQAQCDQEFRVVWPDGTVHWIASRAKIHYSPSGEALRITGVNWDFTERKLAVDLLSRNDDKFRTSI